MIDYYKDIKFAEKGWFWLLALIPLMIIWYIWRLKKQEGEVNFSSFTLLKGIQQPLKAQFRHVLFALRMLAFTLLIAALARPQSSSTWKNKSTEGIDIMISMDISLSMLAKDFKPNRLQVAKDVIIDFIDQRPNDRIGLVIFGGQAFTQCPITSDHKALKNMFPGIKAGSLDQGTAIGSGLSHAVSGLTDSTMKSKVVILISDGVSNFGEVSPLTAGEIAKAYNARVYCIGVGTKGKALQPVAMYAPGEYEYDYVDVEIDEKVMGEISDLTGGKYFRATDKESLKNICLEIDKMEKTIISEKSYSEKAERFLPLELAALIILVLEFILRFTLFKAIP